MVIKTQHASITEYRTKDGSWIRELMHPAVHGNTNQSLAEARLEPGQRTYAHRHLRSEELYTIITGHGHMHLGEVSFDIGPGDTVCIPPGVVHSLENTGAIDLRLLCCSSPAYSHVDTQLLETPVAG